MKISSYQKRKQEIKVLEERVDKLKKELFTKGNIFFKKHEWIGFNQMVYGMVIGGQMQDLKIEYSNGGVVLPSSKL